MRRTPGVFQRCTKACRKPCRQHRWSYLIELPRGGDGRRRQVSKAGFATQSDARAARDEVLTRFRAGTLPPDRDLRLAQAARVWLQRKIETGSIRPNTALSYSHHIESYLIPHLGEVRLSELRAGHIEAAYSELRRTGGRNGLGLPTPSLLRVHATLRSFLRDAVKRGELIHDPTQHVSLPKATARRPHPWTPEEYKSFETSVRDHRLFPLFRLAALSGLRRGEIAGLRWQDVDLVSGVLTVNQQAAQVGYEIVIAQPKSASGEGRRVHLDPTTIDILRRWRRQQKEERVAWGAAWSDTGLVFTREDGTGWQPERITRTFQSTTRKSGVRECRFHDLRHLAASLMIAAGVDITMVSKRLGHSSIRVTADTYGHIYDTAGEDAAERAARLVM